MAFKMKSPFRQMYDCPECGAGPYETLEEMMAHFNSVHQGNLGPPIPKDNTQIQGLDSDDDDKKKDQRLIDE
jgi:hypothetical protein